MRSSIPHNGLKIGTNQLKVRNYPYTNQKRFIKDLHVLGTRRKSTLMFHCLFFKKLKRMDKAEISVSDLLTPKSSLEATKKNYASNLDSFYKHAPRGFSWNECRRRPIHLQSSSCKTT